MSMKEDMKPLAYALADAIGTDFATGAQGSNSFAGSRKAVLELFEGYSPTVISGIDNSLYDPGNKVLAVDQHIFGNVGALTIVEGQQSTIHCFVYDRSKRPEGKQPWDSFWSRKMLYEWLDGSCKAIYFRSIFDTQWDELPNGRGRLHQYVLDRKHNGTSRDSYNNMWDVSPAQLEG